MAKEMAAILEDDVEPTHSFSSLDWVLDEDTSKVSNSLHLGPKKKKVHTFYIYLDTC